MSSLLLKRSNTAGSIPSSGDLTNSTNGADVAINTADKRLYVKNGSGVIVEVGTTPGSFVVPTGPTGSRPASPVTGQTFFNTTIGDLEQYNGTSWVSSGSSSVTAAAASASAASTSASNAATSASSASSSASSASSSASAADSAKIAAEAARDATLAAFDSFDDRYLGSKASDPSVDNDGNALVAGALYFNTSDQTMKLYTGSAWVSAYVSGADVVYLTTTQTLTNKTISYSNNTLTGVQPTLVSGTTIKTVNSTSLLGSGDITISGGVSPDSIVTLTSGTSWTCPTGVTKVRGICVGGGGGGGAGNGSVDGSGGGGGGSAVFIASVTPGTAYTYSIGAAGAGAASSNASGSAGGSTTITIAGVSFTGAGGGGGIGGTSYANPGAGGGGSVGGSNTGFVAKGTSGIKTGGISSSANSGGTAIFGSDSYGYGGGSAPSYGDAGGAGRIILELYK